MLPTPRGFSLVLFFALTTLVALAPGSARAQSEPPPDNGLGTAYPGSADGLAGAGSSYFYSGNAGASVTPLPGVATSPNGTAGASTAAVPYFSGGGATGYAGNGVFSGNTGGTAVSGFTNDPSACALRGATTGGGAGTASAPAWGSIVLALLAFRYRRRLRS